MTQNPYTHLKKTVSLIYRIYVSPFNFSTT